ncbi:16714_t:CDS:2, partial [Racocetra fulgida]
DCFNSEIQQYTSTKAEYCQSIGIAKKGVQTALDTGTIDKFIVTNPHIISHHDRPKKQLQDSLNDINQSSSQKTNKKILHESDITNKSLRKCSYCNSIRYYAKT